MTCPTCKAPSGRYPCLCLRKDCPARYDATADAIGNYHVWVDHEREKLERERLVKNDDI